MAKSLDIKSFIKHLANGSLADNLCVVCLTPLQIDKFQSIFNLICKEDRCYCIADVLQTVCQVQFHDSEYYNICNDCFAALSVAHKLYLQVKETEEIFTFYTNELLSSIENVKVNPKNADQKLYITLPDKSEAETHSDQHLFKDNKDFSNSISYNLKLETVNENNSNKHTLSNKKRQQINKTISNYSESVHTDELLTNKGSGDSNSEDIIFSVEDGEAIYFKERNDSSSQLQEDQDSEEDVVIIVNEKKQRKKRDPLNSINCTRCPVKYRFVSKLRKHMKSVHDVEMFYCKKCKIITEQKEEYEKHLGSHTGEYQCILCNAFYKKERTLLTHMLSHQRTNNFEQTENCNICEVCGILLESEESLQQHYSDKHIKRYTCYYCSRRYMGESALNKHLKKHENKMKSTAPQKQEESSKRSVCTTCGKDFVNERSLLWHQRLHDNDKPFPCHQCGRRFVSRPRRNQHVMCTHSLPTRRCPLCPALFHLRSMVNTHIKRVHLKTPKVRNRTSKYENVSWKTKTVPIQELSISIQDKILELQAKMWLW